MKCRVKTHHRKLHLAFECNKHNHQFCYEYINFQKTNNFFFENRPIGQSAFPIQVYNRIETLLI